MTSTLEYKQLLRQHVQPRSQWQADCDISESETISVGPRLANLELLGERILIDDEDAALVLVFPREIKVGGTVDPGEVIEDPEAACRAIFTRAQNPQSVNSLGESFSLLSSGPVRAGLYQSTVRTLLLRTLATAGLTMKAFQSIDGDEIFVKLSLPLDGKVIRRLAQRYKYKLAFTHVPPDTSKQRRPFARSKTIAKFVEVKAPAYIEYDEALDAGDAMRFRHIDAIRIIHRCVDDWLDLAEMTRQNIMIRHFPAAQYDQVKSLNDDWIGHWSDLRSPWWQLPTYEEEDRVRDYFGEKVTFYFHWFAFYTRCLVPLGVCGLLCALRRLSLFDLSLEHQRTVQVVFSAILCAWAAVFNEHFVRKAATNRQRWGMQGGDAVSPDRHDYNRELEHSTQLYWRRVLSQFCVVALCILFATWLLVFEAMCSHSQTKKRMEGWRRPVIVVSIKGVGWLWGKVAPFLVGLQNHRTDERYDDALTWTLASVKLFVAIFPFFNIAFLKAYLEPICPPEGSTRFADAVWQVYGPDHWPQGIEHPIPMSAQNATPIEGSLDFLKYFTTVNGLGQTCLQGCYPEYCEEGNSCVTNCTTLLEVNLLGLYVVHLCCTVFFIAIPIILTKCIVKEEILRVKDEEAAARFGDWPSPLREVARCLYHWWYTSPKEDEEAVARFGDWPSPLQEVARCLYHWWYTSPKASDRDPNLATTRYTFMQFQSKCCESAKYEYYSWGGSQVEDFLELAIGFALLTSFGIHLPIMATLAACSHIVEFRLVAYRMTNVTCRPMPVGAAGIGVWQRVFEACSEVAIVINVASAVFVMHPMRQWKLDQQLFAFILLEHGLVLARRAIKGMISAEPSELVRNEDFNAHMTDLLMQNTFEDKYAPVTLPADERQNIQAIDLGLGPSTIDVELATDIGFL